jgi:hypothetical protein
MRSGKFNGENIRSVPTDYVERLIVMAETSIADCNPELERRVAAKGIGVSWAEKPISIGLRSFARQHHPDAGDDVDAMQVINGAGDMLRPAVRR